MYNDCVKLGGFNVTVAVDLAKPCALFTLALEGTMIGPSFDSRTLHGRTCSALPCKTPERSPQILGV